MKIKRYRLFLESHQTEESVKEICERYGIKNWSINSEGLVDVDGDVDLYYRGLSKLPLKFGKVTGYFNCSSNRLTSLEGSPKEVGGYFGCSHNQLTTLEGAPEKVGGDFYCYFNQLITLKGSPKEVVKSFDCRKNQLTSLEGCPREVGGVFNCSYNKLTSLEGSPEKVGAFDCSFNKLVSLIGGPQIVLGIYYAPGNQIVSFEGFPDDFEVYIDFNGNPVQDILVQFPIDVRVKAIHLINDYDAIWNGKVVEERLEMVKEKLGLV